MIPYEVQMFDFIDTNTELLLDQSERSQYGKLQALKLTSEESPLGFESRTKLDQLFVRVMARFNSRQDAINNQSVPRCMELSVFDKWKELARYAETPKAGYCTDCTPAYQEKMINKRLCMYPNTDFFAKKFEGEWELIGVRVGENDVFKDTNHRKRVTKDNWVDTITKLNLDND